VDVDREETRLGGAANVAHNVHALGAVPVLVGAVGEDAAGERFLGSSRHRAWTARAV